MSAPTNHWKLGFFVVTSVMLGLTAIVVLGARSLQRDTVSYTTYFDESVQGLDVGSPVKFRGVTIGNVSRVDIAMDRRHVEIVSDLIVTDIGRLGLAVGKGVDSTIRVPSELRMQIASAGITGVKFLQIDFFPEKDNPPPELPFPVPENYIPAAVSVLKNIEDSLVRAINRVPEVTDEVLLVLNGLQTTLSDLKARQLSEQAQQTLANLNGTILKVDALVERAGGDKGLYTSAQRASDAVGDVARNASGLGVEVGQTLRAVQDAASSIQQLSDALERDSDMLVKGRARRER